MFIRSKAICPICTHYIEGNEGIVKIKIGRGVYKSYHEACVERTRNENGFRNYNLHTKEETT